MFTAIPHYETLLIITPLRKAFSLQNSINTISVTAEHLKRHRHFTILSLLFSHLLFPLSFLLSSSSFLLSSPLQSSLFFPLFLPYPFTSFSSLLFASFLLCLFSCAVVSLPLLIHKHVGLTRLRMRHSGKGPETGEHLRIYKGQCYLTTESLASITSLRGQRLQKQLGVQRERERKRKRE